MAHVHSSRRVYCADYERRHKKKILWNAHFLFVKDLNVLSPHSAVSDTDMLCQNCFARLRETLSASRASESSWSVSSESETPGDSNNEISGGGPESTPSRVLPSAIHPKCRQSLQKKKQGQLGTVFSRNVSNRSAAEPSSSARPAERSCSVCEEWWLNVREAFVKESSSRVRSQLLTLIPASVGVAEAKRFIPEASTYMLRKSRQLRNDAGVWKLPERRKGHKNH